MAGTSTPSLLSPSDQYLLGVLTRQKGATVMVKPNSADMELMTSWIEANKLRILIDKVYPLAQIGEAFAYSKAGKATGKVVLESGAGRGNCIGEQRTFQR